MSKKRKPLSWVIGLVFLAAFLCVSAPYEAVGDGVLRLRVNDADAEPGGSVTIVLRTYSSRPIDQGQVCLRVRPNGNDSGPSANTGPTGQFPLMDFMGSEVFSTAGDAVSETSYWQQGEEQMVLIQFSSASGTINSEGGPLAALEFHLSNYASVEDTFSVTIDLSDTFIVGSEGKSIDVVPRNGEIRVRPPRNPLRFQVDSVQVASGRVARIPLRTYEPFAVSAGWIGFRYQGSIADDPPTIDFDFRHGLSVVSVDYPKPGLMIVEFRSPDESFNMVPGEIFSVNLPTMSAVPSQTHSPVFFDRALTFFVGPDRRVIPLELRPGKIEFR